MLSTYEYPGFPANPELGDRFTYLCSISGCTWVYWEYRKIDFFQCKWVYLYRE